VRLTTEGESVGRLEVLSRAVQRGLGLRRAAVGAAVVAALAIAALPATAGAQATHNVNAQPSSWAPNQLEIAFGDQVTWNFPSSGGFAHDVWLIAPGEPADSAGFEVTDGPVSPNGDPVSYTFEQSETWTYVCKIHSFVADGEWQGMVGTAEVSGGGGEDTTPPVTTATLDPASPGPGGTYTGPVTVTLAANDGGGSGVDTIEYSIDGGTPQTHAGSSVAFEVSGLGDHTVTYHATDNADNEEGEKSVGFTIADPDDPPGPGDPPPEPPPALPNAPQTPFVDLDQLPKRLAAADLVRGLRVGAACQAVEDGTMRITVRGRHARKLDLGKKKAVALAKGSAACEQGRLEAVLKPKRKAKKALKDLRGSVKARLELQMTGGNGRAAESETLVLEGKKKRKG